MLPEHQALSIRMQMIGPLSTVISMTFKIMMKGLELFSYLLETH